MPFASTGKCRLDQYMTDALASLTRLDRHTCQLIALGPFFEQGADADYLIFPDETDDMTAIRNDFMGIGRQFTIRFFEREVFGNPEFIEPDKLRVMLFVIKLDRQVFVHFGF